jgi:hypothetical protein
MPMILIDFPEADEELAILKQNLPFADTEILKYVVTFLQTAHGRDEPFTVRDGVNIARYAIKRAHQTNPGRPVREFLIEAVHRTLGEQAARYFPKL